VTEEHLSRDGLRDGSVPKLSGEVRSILGKRLRAVYAALVREPVPERFLKLLETLEATERTS
jgi:Anti-sigma factor NepR